MTGKIGQTEKILLDLVANALFMQEKRYQILWTGRRFMRNRSVSQ